MILEYIINLFFGLLSGFLDLLPSIEFNLDIGLARTFLNFVSVIFYLFPFDTFVALFAISILVNNFRIIISLVKTLWDLIPFV